MKTAQLLEEIQVYIQAVGYQANTQKAITGGIKEFLDWLAIPLLAVKKRHIKAYHRYLKQRPNRLFEGGLSSQSIHLHFWYLRLLFNYLQRQGYRSQHPLTAYALPPVKSESRSILSRPEIQDLYETTQTHKERLTLDFYYGLGLRRSEGQALNLADIDLRQGLLYVRKAKQGSSRKLPLTPVIIGHLQAYLAERPHSPSPALVLNQRQCRMRGASYLRLLRLLLQRSGIDKKIDLHSLRHSIATHLLQAGMPLEQLRNYLGHKHLESTQNYLHYGHQDLS